MKLRMKLSCGLSQYLYGGAKFTPATRNRPASVCDVPNEVGEKLLKTGWFETAVEQVVETKPVVETKTKDSKPVVERPAEVVETNPDDLTPEEQAAIDEELEKDGDQRSQAIEVKTLPVAVAKLGKLSRSKLSGLTKDVLVEVARYYDVPVTEESTKNALITAILAKPV